VEAHRYLELARREDGLARDAREQSEAARRFAARQVDEGLREHFLRLAGRAKMESLAHAARARRFEVIASKHRSPAAAADGSDRPKAAVAWRDAGISSGGSARDTQRAMEQANVELVKQALAACLRDDFDVAFEHLPHRAAHRRSTAKKHGETVP
jgi:hypothetical protein